MTIEEIKNLIGVQTQSQSGKPLVIYFTQYERQLRKIQRRIARTS